MKTLTPQARGMGTECPIPIARRVWRRGQSPSQKIFHFGVSKTLSLSCALKLNDDDDDDESAYVGAFSGPFECLLLHRNASWSRPLVHVPMQSDIPG